MAWINEGKLCYTTNPYVGVGFKCLLLDTIHERTHVADRIYWKKVLVVCIVILINSVTKQNCKSNYILWKGEMQAITYKIFILFIRFGTGKKQDVTSQPKAQNTI
jgi:hypothetical protein